MYLEAVANCQARVLCELNHGKAFSRGRASPPSNGGVAAIGGMNANRGASSYFNKQGGPMGSAGGNTGLPSLNNTKGGVAANNQSQGLGSYGGGGYNKNSAVGANA